MTVYVVRHAKAGDREEWKGDDRQRPLTKSGVRQAEALAKLLEHEPIAGKKSARFAQAATALQDVLGDHQDSITAQGWLRDAGQGTRAFVAGVQRYQPRSLHPRRPRRRAARAAGAEGLGTTVAGQSGERICLGPRGGSRKNHRRPLSCRAVIRSASPAARPY